MGLFSRKKDHYNEGIRAFNRYDYPTAIENLTKCEPTAEIDYILGICYYNHGVDQGAGKSNPMILKGLDYFAKSANAGYAKACTTLANNYYDRDQYKEAEPWLRKAAFEHGDAVAYDKLGVVCATSGRESEALTYFKKSAELGYVPAIFDVGLWYVNNGKPEEGEKWYEKAAKAGYDRAQHNHASYLSKHGRRAEAIEWYEKAAKQGLFLSKLNLAGEYNEIGQYSKTISLLEDVAANNDTAKCELAVAYYNKGRVADAERTLRSADMEKDPDVALLLYAFYIAAGNEAMMEKMRQYVEQNPQTAGKPIAYKIAKFIGYSDAEKWIKAEADQGYTSQCVTLGWIYANKKDYKSAEIYYLKAALKGSPVAMYNLAIMCTQGNVADKENRHDNAIKWALLSARNGYHPAYRLLKQAIKNKQESTWKGYLKSTAKRAVISGIGSGLGSFVGDSLDEWIDGELGDILAGISEETIASTMDEIANEMY